MYKSLLYFAAWIPSHVDANLIRTRSFSIPNSLYRRMNFNAFSTLACVSNDNLKNGKQELCNSFKRQYYSTITLQENL